VVLSGPNGRGELLVRFVILYFGAVFHPFFPDFPGGENDGRLQAVAEVEDERGAQPEAVRNRR